MGTVEMSNIIKLENNYILVDGRNTCMQKVNDTEILRRCTIYCELSFSFPLSNVTSFFKASFFRHCYIKRVIITLYVFCESMSYQVQ